jgi:hypothetical protein
MPSARKEFRDVFTGYGWLISFAILLYVGNVLFFSALTDAPNPGFARAVLSFRSGCHVDRRIFHRIRFARDFETGSRYGRYFGGYVCGRTPQIDDHRKMDAYDSACVTFLLHVYLQNNAFGPWIWAVAVLQDMNTRTSRRRELYNVEHVGRLIRRYSMSPCTDDHGPDCDSYVVVPTQ